MITIKEIQRAEHRLRSFLEPSPLLYSEMISGLIGANVYFKVESMQKTGSFKIRGALNALLCAPKNISGVIAYSSGNHGKALAYAGKLLSIPVTLVLANSVTEQKLASIRSLGAEIHLYDPLIDDRVALTEHLSRERNLLIVPPYENEDVIAGQGTCGLEILAQIPTPPDAILVPVGGGGLIAGVSIAVKSSSASIKIIGVEPETANDQQLSYNQKKIVRIDDADIHTICEGLRTNEPGKLAFPYIVKNVDAFITASDVEVQQAMKLIWDELKLVVEPAGALTLASLIGKSKSTKNLRTVVAVICGGNISISDYNRSLIA